MVDLRKANRAPSWDVLLSHLDEPVLVRDRRGVAHRTRFAVPSSELTLRHLLNLRQVSRAWCASPDRLLAQHHTWAADFDCADRLAAAVQACRPPDDDAGGVPVLGASRLVRKLSFHRFVPLIHFSATLDPIVACSKFGFLRASCLF